MKLISYMLTCDEYKDFYEEKFEIIFPEEAKKHK